MSMSNEQNNPRRRFTAQEKVAILREHLIDKTPVQFTLNQYKIILSSGVLMRRSVRFSDKDMQSVKVASGFFSGERKTNMCCFYWAWVTISVMS
jgi:hypothetical protein